MPTYEYRRQDGTTFEVHQRMKDDALTVCPTTGQSVRRIISGGTGLIFKGSGFYQTDYVSGVNGKAERTKKKDIKESEATIADSESKETK